MILILSDKFDTHADLVCSKLKEKDSNFFRFNLDTDSLKKSFVSFENQKWSISQEQKLINSSEIETIWVRRPFVEVSLEEENINDPGFKIWRGEWNKTLLGIYNSLKHANWLNPLARSYQVENKYLQMEYAQKVGFNTPSIIISNEKTKLIEFSEKHGDVVLKLMNQEFYRDYDGKFKGLYVNKITKDVLDSFENYDENPIVLQEYINKAYEVRYTIIGKDHHVCKIESQKSNLANIDWRRYDIPNTPHYPMNPPKEIEDKVNNFMELCGIYFGALDFIVSPNGEWYFLEINTMGQWRWIEDLTDLKISDSIVKFLTNT